MSARPWNKPAYLTTAATWKTGAAPLGFGILSVAYRTTVEGGDAAARTPTYYFRKTFNLPSLGAGSQCVPSSCSLVLSLASESLLRMLASRHHDACAWCR